MDSNRRSELMALIRGRDTSPEVAVRRIAHRIGLPRYACVEDIS